MPSVFQNTDILSKIVPNLGVEEHKEHFYNGTEQEVRKVYIFIKN